MPEEFEFLDEATDAESYQFLVNDNLELLGAIEKEVTNGATPQQLYNHFLNRTKRKAMALRVKQAARHIERGIRGS